MLFTEQVGATANVVVNFGIGTAGLGACALGDFLDDDFNRLLELDGEHDAVVYVIAVGKV